MTTVAALVDLDISPSSLLGALADFEFSQPTRAGLLERVPPPLLYCSIIV